MGEEEMEPNNSVTSSLTSCFFEGKEGQGSLDHGGTFLLMPQEKVYHTHLVRMDLMATLRTWQSNAIFE